MPFGETTVNVVHRLCDSRPGEALGVFPGSGSHLFGETRVIEYARHG
jgi:hypothetical protein